MGHKESIFIFNKINGKKYTVDVNKVSKTSDLFEIIKDNSELSISSRDLGVVLMCDISHIDLEEIAVKGEKAIEEIKKVYLFNNQDIEERNNFLSSTKDIINKIVSNEKINYELDANPQKTSIESEILSGLYLHIFGKYFDTVAGSKREYNLSKYN